jgi:hypothetical protein
MKKVGENLIKTVPVFRTEPLKKSPANVKKSQEVAKVSAIEYLEDPNSKNLNLSSEV